MSECLYQHPLHLRHTNAPSQHHPFPPPPHPTTTPTQHLPSPAPSAHQQTALQEDAPGTLKFHHKLSSWQALRMDKQAMSQRYEQRLADMRGQLEERRRKADEIAKTFR